MKRVLIFMIILISNLFSVRAYTLNYTWTSLDYPGAIETLAFDIDNGKIVGRYTDINYVGHGFVYDYVSDTWMSLDYPNSTGTAAYGINNEKIVGSYESGHLRGFVYDISNDLWTSFDYLNNPDCWTEVYAIDDDGKFVGFYRENWYAYGWSFTHGFLYDGNNWITLDHPSAYPGTINTYLYDIDGGKIVGVYNPYSPYDLGWGFLYDINTDVWITLVYPGSFWTRLYGIDDRKIVGEYDAGLGWRGLLYDLDTSRWITLEYPGAVETSVWGIEDGKIVGVYRDANNKLHGFLAIPQQAVPVPSTIFLLGSGLVGFIYGRKRWSGGH